MNKALSITLIAITALLVSCKWKCKPNDPPVITQYFNPEVLHTFMGYPEGSYFVYKNTKDSTIDTLYCNGYYSYSLSTGKYDDCLHENVTTKIKKYYILNFNKNIQNKYKLINNTADRNNYTDFLSDFSESEVFCPATQQLESVLNLSGTLYYKYNFGLISYQDASGNNYQLISFYINQ